ncbi:hypothetical protein [Pollutibacter soli]|uniref:hypothetical protein n=1 Tax=Pollutibacter soli TaxID=3034157 RepID=UPI003013BC59
MKKSIFLIVMILISVCLRAQEENNKGGEAGSKHSIGLTIGHESVFNGRDENGKKKTLKLPFWGVDYNYRINSKWLIGLHTDIILESFEVEKNLKSGTEEVVERTIPVAPAIIGMFTPGEHWKFGLGAGAEFAKEATYFLNRAAVEYGQEFGKGWEVFCSLQYDFRWNAYDTWTIGLGISKTLGGNGKKKD